MRLLFNESVTAQGLESPFRVAVSLSQLYRYVLVYTLAQALCLPAVFTTSDKTVSAHTVIRGPHSKYSYLREQYG
jgi:hypothetical protein